MLYISRAFRPRNGLRISGVAGRPAPLFESSWAAGTRVDGGKWTESGDGGTTTHLDVVACPGVSPGFTNALRVRRSQASRPAAWLYVQNAWPLQPIGGFLYFRLYLYIDDIQPTAGTSHHPFESQAGMVASVDSNGYTCRMRDGDGNSTDFAFSAPNHDTPGLPITWPKWLAERANGSGVIVKLVNRDWHRLEWAMQRTAVDTQALFYRVYDGTGAQIWNDATNTRWLGSGYPLVSSDRVLPMLDAGGPLGSSIRRFRLGSNGGDFNNVADGYFYWGGFMVRSDDWCGAF